jgi:hypothetical protein
MWVKYSSVRIGGGGDSLTGFCCTADSASVATSVDINNAEKLLE